MMNHLKSRVGRKFRQAVGPALGIPADKKDEILRPAFSAIQSWGIDGDYLEFGVYQGRAMNWAMRHARRTMNDMRFFAFDTFTGLPDVDDMGKWIPGDYACSEEAFRNNLIRRGHDLSRLTCVAGDFRETLTEQLAAQIGLDSAAIVFVDCDLYESTVPVLQFISPHLLTGSIIAFDDWFSFGGDPNRGEIRAVSEWLEEQPSTELLPYRNFGISGTAFVVVQSGAQSEPPRHNAPS